MYWKAFKIDDIFQIFHPSNRSVVEIRDVKFDMDIFNDFDNDSKELFRALGMAIDIVGSRGNIGTIIDTGNYSTLTRNDELILSEFIGNGKCIYQKDPFLLTTYFQLETLKFKDTCLWASLSKRERKFFASYITRLYSKISEIGNRRRDIMYFLKYIRKEHIILPVRECLPNEQPTWTENDGTNITLDRDSLGKLLEKIKQRKIEKFIEKLEKEDEE